MDGRRMGTVKTAAGPALLMAYIFLCAAEDLKYREISVGISVGFAFAGLVISAAGHRDPAELATALLPGLIALILSRAAGGSIGTGKASGEAGDFEEVYDWKEQVDMVRAGGRIIPSALFHI